MHRPWISCSPLCVERIGRVRPDNAEEIAS